MKCEGCGAELAEGAKTCAACGRPVSMGHQMAGETVHVAKEAGHVAEKVGKGIWKDAKAVGGAVKGEFKKKDEKKDEKAA